MLVGMVLDTIFQVATALVKPLELTFGPILYDIVTSVPMPIPMPIPMPTPIAIGIGKRAKMYTGHLLNTLPVFWIDLTGFGNLSGLFLAQFSKLLPHL